MCYLFGLAVSFRLGTNWHTLTDNRYVDSEPMLQNDTSLRKQNGFYSTGNTNSPTNLPLAIAIIKAQNRGLTQTVLHWFWAQSVAWPSDEPKNESPLTNILKRTLPNTSFYPAYRWKVTAEASTIESTTCVFHTQQPLQQVMLEPVGLLYPLWYVSAPLILKTKSRSVWRNLQLRKGWQQDYSELPVTS